MKIARKKMLKYAGQLTKISNKELWIILICQIMTVMLI
jgi:hypothetical protein